MTFWKGNRKLTFGVDQKVTIIANKYLIIKSSSVLLTLYLLCSYSFVTFWPTPKVIFRYFFRCCEFFGVSDSVGPFAPQKFWFPTAPPPRAPRPPVASCSLFSLACDQEFSAGGSQVRQASLYMFFFFFMGLFLGAAVVGKNHSGQNDYIHKLLFWVVISEYVTSILT